ncbi:hypothetical protein TRVL_03788 [Trypanosoma vivax]|uniref:Uncharacterized protein n=1 Tax=Trypanosoma vivax (strain Y486) TaxID=1055687 RepID=G0U2I9_TRYVY|nr:hypothetical protein TRVL_03788 [Trypanosoma vivax]CCC50492.1 hypothetical protein, unlikely [Trypanosoma vivax Y486]
MPCSKKKMEQKYTQMARKKTIVIGQKYIFGVCTWKVWSHFELLWKTFIGSHFHTLDDFSSLHTHEKTDTALEPQAHQHMSKSPCTAPVRRQCNTPTSSKEMALVQANCTCASRAV